jgi:hypothetical protein
MKAQTVPDTRGLDPAMTRWTSRIIGLYVSSND